MTTVAGTGPSTTGPSGAGRTPGGAHRALEWVLDNGARLWRWTDRSVGTLGGRIVLVLALVGGVALDAWAVALSHGRQGAGWWLLVSLFTAAVIALIGLSYSKWIEATPAIHTVGAVIGCVISAGGAAMLRVGSDASRPTFAVIGVALMLIGLTPVAFAIRFDARESNSRVATATVRGRSVGLLLAWVLNAGFIVAATVPVLVLLGVPQLVVWIAAAVWLYGALWRRLFRRWPLTWLAAGAAVIALGGMGWVLLFDLSRTDSSHNVSAMAAGLLVFLGAIEVVALRARHRHGRARPRLRSVRALVGAGALLAIISSIVLVHRFGGVGWGVQALVIAVWLVIGAAFVTRGEGFVVVAIVGALAVWAITNRTSPLPEDPRPATAPGEYIVAIGDSYMAGEGAPTFFADVNVSGANDCRRSPTSYPYLLAQWNNMGLDFVACSGAVADQVTSRGQIGTRLGPVGGLPQLQNRFTTFAPALVLVSIGGNDAFFGDVGKGCALPGTCADLAEVWNGNLVNVQQHVAEAITAITAKFPSSPVVVVPYPEMFEASDSCAGLPLDTKEVTYLRDFVKQLGDSVHRAVDGVKASKGLDDSKLAFFSPGLDAYRGVGICSGMPRSQLPLNLIKLAPTEGTPFQRLLPTNWLHGSFHPNPDGHQRMATLLQDYLHTHYKAFGASEDVTPVLPTAAAADGSQATCADAERPACRSRVSAWMTATTITAFRQIAWPGFGLLIAGLLLGVAFVRGRWRLEGVPATCITDELTVGKLYLRRLYIRHVPNDGNGASVDTSWASVTSWSVQAHSKGALLTFTDQAGQTQLIVHDLTPAQLRAIVRDNHSAPSAEVTDVESPEA